jgi:hypothetical protein
MSNLPSCFNGIEVFATVGTPTYPELSQAEIVGPCNHWLPQIDRNFCSMVPILMCRCYGILLNWRKTKLNE